MDDSALFDDNDGVPVPVTRQKFQKVDLPSLPQGVCKVSASDTHIRVTTYAMHLYFDMRGIYVDRLIRKRTLGVVMFGMYVGYAAVGAACVAGASRKTCQRVASAAAASVAAANVVLTDAMCVRQMVGASESDELYWPEC
jgi:hypothetical protein